MSRPGSRRDHDDFCRREGWYLVRGARGKAVGHHTTYELALPDGRVLRTRVSRPADSTTCGPSLWGHVLEQLQVTEEEFWACVSGEQAPRRASSTTTVPDTALPASLVHQLLRAGVPERDVAAMDLQQAVAAMTVHWSQPDP